MTNNFFNSKWQLTLAVGAILIADMSMSLDNILAIAAIAQDEMILLIFGLCLSVALMGIAAKFIATLMEKYQWIGWLGFLMILYVALKMTWQGLLKILL
jgi:predicted tellurium resistance membrane protein TerC